MTAALLGHLSLARADVVRSKEGDVELNVPRGWVAASPDSPMRKGLMFPDRAVFAQHSSGMYALALREAKEDLAATSLEAYAALVFKLEAAKAKLADRVQSEGKVVHVDGRDVLRFEVRGEYSGARLVYVKYFAQTSTHWMQVQCWSGPSHEADLARDCAAMVPTFRARAR